MDIWYSFDMCAFSDSIIHQAFNDEYSFISVFAKYEQARRLIRELLRYEDSVLDGIEIQSEDCSGYQDEYVIEIWTEDGYLYIGCEPAKRNDKYKTFEGDVAYVFGDCNSKILKSCNYKRIFEVSIAENKNLSESFKNFWKMFGV